jgi:predicted nucleotidyltransferase
MSHSFGGKSVSDNRSSELIPFLTERIIRRFDPLRIVLFGSHARGEAEPDSDIDLLVVFSEVDDKRQVAVEIRRTLADLPVGKDIIVTTPEEIARRGELVGSLLRPALRDGQVLYERS